MSALRARRAAAVALTVAAVAVVPQAAAQDHPNVERGLSASTAYQNQELESVNLFNGNLHLAVPLGFSYPLGGGLAYGFALHYNSNVWELEDGSPAGSVAANPEPFSNAGLGWILTLGRIFPPSTPPWNDSASWLLLEPDGSRRQFFDRLHVDDPLSSIHRYTRDGSYLRMKDLAGGEKQVEGPDGTLRIFRADGKLRRIADPFDNYLNVTYPDATKWVVTDQHGRIQTVNLSTTTGATYGHATGLVLTGFGGTTATYGLQLTATAIERHYKDTATNSSTVTVPLLTRIDFPTGTAASWLFAYHTGNVYVDSIRQPSGAIKSATLPTLGRHDYVYMAYGFPEPAGPCGEPLCLPTWSQSGDGLRSKKVYNAAGALLGTWSYTQVDLGLDTTRTETRVTSPAGDVTRNHFRLSPYGWEHGLPYHPSAKDATGTRYLSQEIYQGSVTAGTKKRSVYLRFATDKPSGMETNQRVESRRVLYHDDGGAYADVTFSGFDGLGHYRQAVTGGNFASANVRTEVVQYNPGAGTYNYDATAGTYGTGHSFTLPATSNRWRLDTFTEVSETEGSQTIKTQLCLENPASPVPGPNGFVKRVRRLKGSAPGANDVLSVFTRDARGNVTRQQLYGGDLQALGTQTDPCAATLPAADAYRIDNTWQNGMLATSEARTASGGTLGVKLTDRTIDTSGLVSVGRDLAGLASGYEYDALGRMTWAKPPAGHGAWSEWVYTKPTSASALALVTARTRNGSKTATILTEEKLKLDALGRPWQEQHLMPNGTWSTRETLYDGTGRVASVSVWGTISEKTTFSGYDPFGRPATVTPPDGSGHQVTYGYKGDRQIDRQAKMATAATGEALTFTTQVYDRQGRLYRFIEASGAAGAFVTTTYAYDAAGRLKSVSTPASVGGSTVTQSRTFTYDHRGFLTAAKSPEKGASGNGTVTWSLFDALGNPGRRVDGGFDVGMTWDRAGRLVETKNRLTNEALETFFYATANGTNDWRRGKLQTANRFNYLTVGTTPFTVRIEETYVYGGVGGRVSSRDTFWANSTSAIRFTQGWAYDPLGSVTTLTYPRCNYTGCTGAAATSRTATFGYSRGALTSATSTTTPTMGTNTLTYHSNDTVAAVTHGNGVTWSQGLDPDRMARPASFQAAVSGTTLWSTGTYQYDGVGNVKAIGGSSFLYDPVSRLTSSNLLTTELGSGTTQNQGFSYDPFGNLTAVSGTSGLTIPVTASTNRLTTVGSGPDCGASEVYYDSAGNLTCWQGNAYSYDPLGTVTRTVLSGIEYDHGYAPSGGRLLTYQPGVGGYRWTLRDLDGKVLRDFKLVNNTWTVERDYLYRDGVLLAAKQPNGEVYHLHPDHLGSPRLVTGNSGVKRAFHAYHPYGAEATAINQDSEPMKFTGHERDLGIATSAADDVDYMFARYYLPRIGRFTRPDPVEGNPWFPQTWNRYAYVAGNPLNFIDPYGLDEEGTNPLDTFEDNIDVPADHWIWKVPTGLLNFLYGSPTGRSGGGGRGSTGRSDAEPEGRECTGVQKFFDTAGDIIDTIGPVALSGTTPIIGAPGIAGLGPAVSGTARPDGSADFYIGAGVILLSSAELATTSLGGSLGSRSVGDRPSGFGLRAAIAAPVAGPLGVRATGFTKPSSRSTTIGVGLVAGLSASLTAGWNFSIRDPLPPRGDCN